MIYVIASHLVNDLASWTKAFNSHGNVREKYNVNVLNIFSSTEDPNHVTLVLGFENEEAITAFTENPEIQGHMAAAGVISKPDFKTFTKVM